MKKKYWIILIIVVIAIVLILFLGKGKTEDGSDSGSGNLAGTSGNNRSYDNLLTQAANNAGISVEEAQNKVKNEGATPIDTLSKLGVILATSAELNKAQTMAKTFAKSIIGKNKDSLVGNSLDPFLSLTDRVFVLTSYFLSDGTINPYTDKYTSLGGGLRFQRDYTSHGKKQRDAIFARLTKLGTD